jgi:hypothetical protein
MPTGVGGELFLSLFFLRLDEEHGRFHNGFLKQRSPAMRENHASCVGITRHGRDCSS